MDGHVWISQWGVGPERLLTEHAVSTIAWSPNGGRLAYGTLDGFDEDWTGTLRLHDLVNGEDVVLGNIAAPWQAIFTSNNQLIYLYDNALQIWSIPAEKSLKEGAALERTVPLKNVPEGALYGEGASLAMALSPSERYMALLRQGIGYETGTLGILDLETGEEYLVDDLLRNDQSAFQTIVLPNGTSSYCIKSLVGTYGLDQFTRIMLSTEINNSWESPNGMKAFSLIIRGLGIYHDKNPLRQYGFCNGVTPFDYDVTDPNRIAFTPFKSSAHEVDGGKGNVGNKPNDRATDTMGTTLWPFNFALLRGQAAATTARAGFTSTIWGLFHSRGSFCRFDRPPGLWHNRPHNRTIATTLNRTSTCRSGLQRAGGSWKAGSSAGREWTGELGCEQWVMVNG